MKRNRTGGSTFYKMPLLGIVTITAMAVFALAVSAYAAEGVNVSCYLGNLYVGNTVVYDVRTAANACNDLYRICRGDCSGCFHDFDYVENVCVGPDNRMYLK